MCDPSFLAQVIVLWGGQHHAKAALYLRGVNDVLSASAAFLIRFGYRSVQTVSADIHRATKSFVKISPVKAKLSVGTEMNFICNFRTCDLICVN